MKLVKEFDRSALVLAVWSAEFVRAFSAQEDLSVQALSARALTDLSTVSTETRDHLTRRAAASADQAVEALRLLIDVEFRLMDPGVQEDCRMPWWDFVESCRALALTDDDGFGELATDDRHVSNVRVYPSEALGTTYDRPRWATHVVWYSK